LARCQANNGDIVPPSARRGNFDFRSAPLAPTRQKGDYHVVPPPATRPDTLTPDGFNFGYFGVRVPAVVVSPYMRPGNVIRPSGATPFDHTSIIATLRKLFGFGSLTARDAGDRRPASTA
jgi:hypothetical protein